MKIGSNTMFKQPPKSSTIIEKRDAPSEMTMLFMAM